MNRWKYFNKSLLIELLDRSVSVGHDLCETKCENQQVCQDCISGSQGFFLLEAYGLICIENCGLPHILSSWKKLINFGRLSDRINQMVITLLKNYPLWVLSLYLLLKIQSCLEKLPSRVGGKFPSTAICHLCRFSSTGIGQTG